MPALPWLGRLPRVGPRLARLTDLGAAYLHRPRLLAETTALSVLVQLANVVLAWLIGLGLGLPGAHLLDTRTAELARVAAVAATGAPAACLEWSVTRALAAELLRNA